MTKSSSYYQHYKEMKRIEKINQIQNENYDGDPVKYDDFLKDPETEIQDEQFHELKEVGISTRQSTDNINRIELNKQQEQMEMIAKNYDYIFDDLFADIQFGAENLEIGKKGKTAPWHGTKGLELRIVLDSKRLNSEIDTREETFEDIKSNWHVPIDMSDNRNIDVYTITHEMGHALEHCIFEKLLKNNASNSKYYDTRWLAIKVRNEVENIAKNKYTKSNKDVSMNVSRYSSWNSQEWFAETFTNLVLSDRPMPVALALKDYIERFK